MTAMYSQKYMSSHCLGDVSSKETQKSAVPPEDIMDIVGNYYPQHLQSPVTDSFTYSLSNYAFYCRIICEPSVVVCLVLLQLDLQFSWILIFADSFSNAVWFYIVLTYCITMLTLLPSVLWRCWLGERKGIRPVKNWAVGCWRGYLSGARCKLAYGPADATATHCLLLQ